MVAGHRAKSPLEFSEFDVLRMPKWNKSKVDNLLNVITAAGEDPKKLSFYLSRSKKNGVKLCGKRAVGLGRIP